MISKKRGVVVITNNQIRLFRFISKKPRTVAECRKRLKITDDEWGECFDGAWSYFAVPTREVFIDTTVIAISDLGKTVYKKHHRADADYVRGWITTVIAFLAFILSIISLTWQMSTSGIWKNSTQELSLSQKSEVATTAADYASCTPISD